MTEPAPPLLEFPCDFPVKAIGSSHEGLQQEVLDIIRRHAPEVDEGAVTCRQSGGGKYTAVTVTVQAQSKAQLDAIYQDLTASPAIAMVL